MEIRKFIRATIKEYINKQDEKICESWFHGTPDSREIEKEGGFANKTISVEYATDPNKLKSLQKTMNDARKGGDDDLYWELLNKVPNFKKIYTYKKPLFLSDKYSVAKTYADPQRAFDYQNAIQKTYEVNVDCGKNVRISAIGDRFRFISVDKVKKGFIDAGIPEHEIDKLISMFNFYISDNKGIKTDVIAAIGNWLGFDCIDVVGVLDSYHGGNVKSTVRMVLDPTKVKVKNVKEGL